MAVKVNKRLVRLREAAHMPGLTYDAGYCAGQANALTRIHNAVNGARVVKPPPRQQ